jgi:hypothetical protein
MMGRNPVTHALKYYLLATSKNQLNKGFQALKSPRNLAAIVIVFVVLGLLVNRLPIEVIHQQLQQGLSFHYLYFIIILLEIALKLLLRGGLNTFSNGLNVKPSDAEFLFASPLTRKQIVLFKLLNIQKVTVLIALGLSVVLPYFFEQLSTLRVFVGLLLMVSLTSVVYFLLRYFVSFCAMKGHLYVAQLMIAGFITALIYNSWQVVTQAQSVFNNLARYNETPAFEWFMAPLDWIIEPIFSPSWLAFSQTVWMPLLVCLVLLTLFFTRRFHYAFFEQNIEGAGRSADIEGQVKKQKKTRLFKLKPTGPQYQAFVWKSIMASPLLGSVMGRSLFAGFLIGIVVLSHLPLPLGGQYIMHTLLVSMIFAMVFIGPLLFRGGLRHDMPYLDLLKSMPIKGRQLIVGEMVLPVLICYGIVLLAAFCLNEISKGTIEAVGKKENGSILMVSMLPLAFNLIVARFTIHNLIALYLPSFVSFDQKGFGEVYQLFFRAIISAIVLALLFLPAYLTMSYLFGYSNLFVDMDPKLRWSLAVNIGGLIVLLGSGLLIYFSEYRYQHFDISRENTRL